MNSFNDFLKKDIPQVDNIKEQDINELIDKYSTYSQDDLMEEFLRESQHKKQNGELDDSQINKVKNILSPYLSTDQKEKLNNLLDMVKQ